MIAEAAHNETPGQTNILVVEAVANNGVTQTNIHTSSHYSCRFYNPLEHQSSNQSNNLFVHQSNNHLIHHLNNRVRVNSQSFNQTREIHRQSHSQLVGVEAKYARSLLQVSVVAEAEVGPLVHTVDTNIMVINITISDVNTINTCR